MPTLSRYSICIRYYKNGRLTNKGEGRAETPEAALEVAAHWAAMEERNGYYMVKLPSEWRGAQIERGWLRANRLTVRIWVEAAPALAAYAN